MNRKTLILGGVLIGLIVLAYVYKGPLKTWQDNLGKPNNILAKIDINKVDKLEVTTGDNAVVLSKQGEKWRYNNTKDFYANPSLIATVLTSLKEAATSDVELISNNLDKKKEFKTDSAGLMVKVYSGEKMVADFIVGSPVSFGGTYISSPESSLTYAVQVDLSGALRQAEWRDLTIFSVAKEKIKKIRFQYPNREFTVELQNDKWTGILPEKFTVNQEKMGKILQHMSDLKAKEIPEQSFKNTGLDKHLIIIEASGEEVDNILMIGQNLDGRSYAKKGDSDNVYLIDRTVRDELDKWIWQLR